MRREDLSFPSGDGSCAAWLWRPEGPAGDVPCVVMGHGFSLTRHDGLEHVARPLVEAGAAVLAFDHRFLGDSPGLPRQRFRIREHHEDWRAALGFAGGLDGVRGLVPWTFSLGAVSAIPEALRRPGDVEALLLVCPFLDGLDRLRRTPPGLAAWIVPRALADAAGRHTTIPVTGPPGARAAMTLPGEADGFARAVPAGSPWRNAISPRFFLGAPRLRPVRLAARLSMPVLVAMGQRDVSVSRSAIERLVREAPRAELVRLPYDHFEPVEPIGGAHVAGLQAAFLRRHGVL